MRIRHLAAGFALIEILATLCIASIALLALLELEWYCYRAMQFNREYAAMIQTLSNLSQIQSDAEATLLSQTEAHFYQEKITDYRIEIKKGEPAHLLIRWKSHAILPSNGHATYTMGIPIWIS